MIIKFSKAISSCENTSFTGLPKSKKYCVEGNIVKLSQETWISALLHPHAVCDLGQITWSSASLALFVNWNLHGLPLTYRGSGLTNINFLSNDFILGP